jgi:UDP-galactopyranose mutase
MLHASQQQYQNNNNNNYNNMSVSYIERRGYAFMACTRTTSADVVVVTEVSCALGKKALGILTTNHKAFFANAVSV